MGLLSLDLLNFRNLKSIQIEPNPGLNIVVGENGAGKTNLLETIFYLSYGRSFQRLQAKHLITQEEPFFRLLCRLDDGVSHIGLERNLKKQNIRINRESISRISELSTLLPVIVLHPDSHQLISAGPDNRRQFMDWGVFHVEHGFINVWKNYKKALSQRNAALRLQQSDHLCALWNKELIEYAEIIEQLRLKYLNHLIQAVDDLAKTLFPKQKVSLVYKRGWPSDVNYKDYLNNNLYRDKERGFTQSGPHRADIGISIDGNPAQTSISRGQQKKLVSLLKIAQLTLFTQTTKRRCILLFDDLPAELDQSNQKKIMSILSKLDIQLFISAIKLQQIDCSDWNDYSVFHVEHGIVVNKNKL